MPLEVYVYIFTSNFYIQKSNRFAATIMIFIDKNI